MLKIKVEERFGKLKLVVYLPKSNTSRLISNGGTKTSSKDL